MREKVQKLCCLGGCLHCLSKEYSKLQGLAHCEPGVVKDLLDVEAVTLVLLQHATQERHALWADCLPDGVVKENLAGEQLS